ncbi:MAG TPA: N-6 DNA methylase, partial [Pyrinomonadaceae bacterium]|nr:N-6 DNA methylase [Pyrinomonadaceae bacterium]
MSSYSPTDLEAYVRQRAPEVTRDILRAAKGARNEADLVAEVEKVLGRFGDNFDVTLHPERERTLINGRADAVYNRLVIEYEAPGSLRPSNNHGHNKHAIGQVTQYMDELERLDRQRKERLAGVVLDGGYYIFVRHRDEHFRIDDPVPVNTQSTETFLRYLLSLATELALTPENLVRDFGENSNTARQVVPAIYHALRATDDAKVKVLFSQWKRQFQEVSGYDSSSEQLSATDLARLYAVRDREPDIEHLFFAIHTYYATFIKVLALQVAHYYLMPKVGTGLAAVANYDTDKLRDYLLEMERGGLFTQLGIRNFLEGDFFGWYLEIWDEAMDTALRRLIGDLANYSLVTLDVDPEETRDLLKHLYQNLMPKKLRHALGEYYTPDWLAERLLNQLGYKGEPQKRLLDPACGSGTFLVLAIKRIRQYADEKMLPPAQVLEQVLNNIVGFDLNPLAVISARTNFLLALGDLLSHRKGEISIPVYLADSVLTPSQGDDLYTQHGYSFQTAVGRFTVPRSLVDAHYIDQLAHLLEECVHSGTKTEQFKTRLLRTFPLKADEDKEEVNVAVVLYEQLLDLEQKGVNGIWARIIKNAFAPRFQGRFDYVAGNPPWVNWESLPKDYREDAAPLWLKHKLFSKTGYDAILGGAKDDISVLMTYVALDNYLNETGRLGFVITQSVFKAEGGGQGFRRFQLANGTPINVIAVDDMVEIKPFEGAANRTSVFVMERGRKIKYPAPYNLWRKAISGKRVPEDSTLEEALGMCAVRHHVAQPIYKDDLTSSWITGRRRAIEAVQKILGASAYQAREGTNTGGAN